MDNDEKDLELDVDQEEETETLDEEEEVDSDSEESLEADEESDEEEDEEEEAIDWQARALKAEKAIEKAKKANKKKKVNSNINNNLSTKAESPDDDIRAEIESLKLAERKRQYGYEHGLSPLETDKVFQIDPDPSDKTLKDPFVKAGLQALRAKERVDKNTPSSSAKRPIIQSKKFQEMSEAEKNKAFREYTKAKGLSN